MSDATMIVIVHSAGDDAVNRLQTAVTAGMSEGWGRLTRVDSVAPLWDPAAEVHIGSFNGLDEPQLRKLIVDANWQNPERLQVLIQRQDDPVPTEVEIFDHRLYARFMRQAAGRGFAIPGTPPQIEFFRQLCGADDNPAAESETVGMSPPWTFEVVSFGPEFQFEFSRIIPGPDGRRYWHPRIWAKSVGFAFDGVGIRWQNPVDPEDVDESIQTVVRSLNPGDRVEINGQIASRCGGAAEITQVMWINRLARNK